MKKKYEIPFLDIVNLNNDHVMGDMGSDYDPLGAKENGGSETNWDEDDQVEDQLNPSNSVNK